MNSEIEKKITPRHNQRLFVGVILVLFGAMLLFQRWFDITTYAFLLLGFAMLAWGSLTHRTGWLIPGGVLSGIGLGILAMEGPWNFPAEMQGGIFLVCFAFGWFAITLLSAIFTCTQWWALIPGGIMAVIGGAILVTRGGIHWQDLNLVYAAVLIVVGLLLLFFRSRPRQE